MSDAGWAIRLKIGIEDLWKIPYLFHHSPDPSKRRLDNLGLPHYFS
jgi:hypothetical protein